MDVRAIRVALASVAASGGFQSWDYVPDDPQVLPVAVVGGLREMTRLNQHIMQFQIGVTFLASMSDPRDANARLDLVLSAGEDGSFITLLDSVPLQGEGSGPWRSIRFVSSGAYTRLDLPGGGVALGVEVVLELTA